ncbi:MAG: DNA-directed RNA polymerase subunit omega [Lachnospiraceae bacterium]|nr:DNA-directed RNA polymerase subunit omega [Lachnospiraceae bacterium]
MIHPSYVELMRVVNEETALVGEEPVVNSRYSIVCATAKRARQIIDGDEPYISGAAGMKPLSIAVEELYDGQLKILTDEEVEEKNEELSEYLEKKRKQDAIFAQREKEEEKLRREQEAVARAEAEAKAAAKVADSFDDEDDADEDFEDDLEEEAEEASEEE